MSLWPVRPSGLEARQYTHYTSSPHAKCTHRSPHHTPSACTVPPHHRPGWPELLCKPAFVFLPQPSRCLESKSLPPGLDVQMCYILQNKRVVLPDIMSHIVILTQRRLNQEDHNLRPAWATYQYETRLNYIAISYLKKLKYNRPERWLAVRSTALVEGLDGVPTW